jgi:heme/copper-type cytochrome/quinol oxidase subunit 3
MVFLMLMAYRALGGQFTSRQHDGLSAAALYWHTMVGMFFLIWLGLYVTK